MVQDSEFTCGKSSVLSIQTFGDGGGSQMTDTVLWWYLEGISWKLAYMTTDRCINYCDS
jgi:hypothetical protein